MSTICKCHHLLLNHYPHHEIEKYYSEYIAEPFIIDNVPMRVLVGGGISLFMKDAQVYRDISSKEKHSVIISDWLAAYANSIAPYLEELLQKDAILNEFRNPSRLTKRLISLTTLSQTLIIAAYITEDRNTWQQVMLQEKNKYGGESLEEISGYIKLEEFLTRKDSENKF